MPLNKQEVLNLTIENLVKQGGASYDSVTNQCWYRFQGLKCAIGHFIPDDKYEVSMEGNGVYHSAIQEVLEARFGKLDDVEWDFLNRLQSMHDYAADWQMGYPPIAGTDRGDNCETPQYNVGDFWDQLRRECKLVCKEFKLDPSEAVRKIESKPHYTQKQVENLRAAEEKITVLLEQYKKDEELA